MKIQLEFEREENGRWLAEAPDLPGVMAYGASPKDAATRVQALALRVIADKLENGEFVPSLDAVSFVMPHHEPVAVC